MVRIFPSLISADLMALGKEIKVLEGHVAGFHIDVMDFHFVPNLTWGFSFIEAMRKATDKPLQIHLMVDYPEKYLPRMCLRNRDIVSIHWECKTNQGLERILEEITSYGWIPSIALNPDTHIVVLEHLPLIKHVLLMTVEPGFSGQELIPNMLPKLSNLAQFRKEQNLSFTIAVDGGITSDNCHELVQLGADQLCIASAIFQNPDRIEALNAIKRNCK